MRTHHSLGSSGSERFAAPSLRSGVSMRKPLLPYLERRCVMRRIIVPVILALVVAALAAAAAFAVDSTTFTTSAPKPAAVLPKADLLIMQAPDVLHAAPGQL